MQYVVFALARKDQHCNNYAISALEDNYIEIIFCYVGRLETDAWDFDFLNYYKLFYKAISEHPILLVCFHIIVTYHLV